jgi:ABC-type polysaccharide/polyol phosphate export permease
MSAHPDAITLDTSMPVDFPQRNQAELAQNDIKQALTDWRLWLMLAYQDIKLRYRRSILGPFWITLSMAITVYSMGYLYGRLFHTDLDQYYPFLVAGMLSWSLISTVILDMIDGLVNSESLIKQIKLPYTLYIHRIAARNILIFFHNILVIIPVLAIFHHYAKVNFYTLLLIPGLLVIYFNSITYGIILGMIGARYRDVSQIVKSLVQVVFFVTPVMWAPGILGHGQYNYIADLNPFYAFIEIIRQPLLGHLPTTTNLAMVLLVSALGLVFSLKMLTKYRARIVYWL